MTVNTRKETGGMCAQEKTETAKRNFPRGYPVLIVVTHSILKASRADLTFTVNESMLLQNVAVQL